MADLQNSPAVEKVREKVTMTGEDASGILKFGVTEYLFADTPTEQFVGSYSVSATVNPDGTVTFTVTNTTSMGSLLRYIEALSGGLIDTDWTSYDRDIFGPGGNLKQLYKWTEELSTWPDTAVSNTDPIKKGSQ